jgi:hypothetical protein
VTRSGRWSVVRAFAVVLTSACNPAPSAEEMKAALEDGNYCTTAEECVYVGSECPFGCGLHVNAAEAVEVREMLEAFSVPCEYDCWEPVGAECVDGSCEPLY